MRLPVRAAFVALCFPALLTLTDARQAPAASGSQQAKDLLAAARVAMGGEAAFAALKSLEIFGNVVQTVQAGRAINVDGQIVSAIVGGRSNLSLDIKVALPDKYVRINRFAPDEGSSKYIDEFRGFNGSDLIRDTSAQFGGVTDSKVMPNPKLDSTKRQYLLDAKHAFAEILLPMLANAYDGYPLDFSVGGEEQLPSGKATIVNAEGADGLHLKLYLDNATHLPMLVTGLMKPMLTNLFVEFYMPEEEWRMTIADYKVSNGFKWPHKMTSKFEDDTTEEIHLDRFSINPKFGDHT